jgi:hypothetical protein
MVTDSPPWPADRDVPSDLDQVLLDDDSINESDPDPEPVSYLGSDFDVDGLVRRFERGDIIIPSFGADDQTIETAGFQRRFVWRRPQMDRFIESLLLGYPIPGVFFVQQLDRRYLVLDGQQRIRTLAAFYKGLHNGQEFTLRSVAKRFEGLSYRDLDDETRRTLDNTFIQATIVRTDGSPTSLDAVYQIFERLNTGGTQLTPHEIRVALYSGPLIEFLTSLNSVPAWRSLYGKESPRLRDQEMILRFIALYIQAGSYRRPLRKFLNDFAATHRGLDSLPADVLRERFEKSTELLLAGPGRAALRATGNQLNAALTEAVLVGLAKRLDYGAPPAPADVTTAVRTISQDSRIEAVISRATADEESVRTRLAIADRAFATI